MTIEEEVKRLLSKDMDQEQIDVVLVAYKNSKYGKPMKGRWAHTPEDYTKNNPSGFIAAISLSVKLFQSFG